MKPITRLLQLMAPFRWWIALAVLLSFGTLGASVGLMAMSAYLIHQARQAGASKWMIARMLGNVGLDLTIGAIPLLGDAFDMVFKSNRRNARLLKRHLSRSGHP